MADALRRAARAAVAPEKLRLVIAQARRGVRDLVSGDGRRIARATGPIEPAHPVVEVAQEIKRSVFFEGKLENIRLGAARLDGLVVAPGEIFSFWASIGRPLASAGFHLGRSIRGGAVEGDVGGGLCQLSGIAYELGLRAGLDPVERFPHSRDLYTEDQRFTPLGLDATLVWPYKDLRLANRFDVPVRFGLRVDELTITASLHASRTLEPMALQIERTDHDGWRDVAVTRGAVIVSRDRYLVAAT